MILISDKTARGNSERSLKLKPLIYALILIRLLDLSLFYHFRKIIIWSPYTIRLLPKTLISAIVLLGLRQKRRQKGV